MQDGRGAEVQTSVRGGADNGLNRAQASEPARQAPADAPNSWPS